MNVDCCDHFDITWYISRVVRKDNSFRNIFSFIQNQCQSPYQGDYSESVPESLLGLLEPVLESLSGILFRASARVLIKEIIQNQCQNPYQGYYSESVPDSLSGILFRSGARVLISDIIQNQCQLHASGISNATVGH